MDLTSKKRPKVPSQIFQMGKQTTFIIVLEAFIRKAEFAPARHLLIDGIMGASLSSAVGFL